MTILGTPAISFSADIEYWIILIQAVLIVVLIFKWTVSKRRLREMERFKEEERSNGSDK